MTNTPTNDALELVEMKNQERTKLRIVNAGLIVLSVLLLVVVIFMGLASRITPPSLNANVDVLTDVTPLKVPDVIVSGEPFTYTTSGFKNKFENAKGEHESPTAYVRLQYTCELGDGKTNTFPFLDFYSNTPAGHYDIKRETALPVSTRVKSADRCYMESYSEYKLFVTNNAGETSEINFIEKNRSNYFKLVVNPVTPTATTQNVTVQSSNQTGTTSTSAQNPNVAQSNPTSNSTTTNNSTTNNTTNNNSTTTPTPEPTRQGLIPAVINGLLGL